MHRLQLKHYLEAARVPEDRYLLVGAGPPRPVGEGAYILRPNHRQWEVLVWHTAVSGPCLTFLTETDACEYVLDMLTGRPSGRVPADLAEPAAGAELTEATARLGQPA